MKLFSCIFIAAIASSSFISAQPAQKAKDYLRVPGPIAFNKFTYNLSWSSHPSANYYKQEYIPAGENPDKYSRMIMIEAVTGSYLLKDLVKSKTGELDSRKKTDAVTNYSVIENKATGEYLLDFTLSAPGANNETIVEWNAYRYRKTKDKSGKDVVVLFAYSRRAYGSAATGFLTSLKKDRPADIQALAVYQIPVVSLGN